MWFASRVVISIFWFMWFASRVETKSNIIVMHQSVNRFCAWISTWIVICSTESHYSWIMLNPTMQIPSGVLPKNGSCCATRFLKGFLRFFFAFFLKCDILIRKSILPNNSSQLHKLTALAFTLFSLFLLYLFTCCFLHYCHFIFGLWLEYSIILKFRYSISVYILFAYICHLLLLTNAIFLSIVHLMIHK